MEPGEDSTRPRMGRSWCTEQKVLRILCSIRCDEGFDMESVFENNLSCFRLVMFNENFRRLIRRFFAFVTIVGSDPRHIGQLRMNDGATLLHGASYTHANIEATSVSLHQRTRVHGSHQCTYADPTLSRCIAQSPWKRCVPPPSLKLLHQS